MQIIFIALTSMKLDKLIPTKKLILIMYYFSSVLQDKEIYMNMKEKESFSLLEAVTPSDFHSTIKVYRLQTLFSLPFT